MPSVYIGEDADLIARILDLHRAGPRILDPTYGHGGFWRGRRDDGRRIVGLDLRGPEELNESRAAALAGDRALSQDPASLPKIDAVYFQGAVLDPLTIIDDMERELGVPVIASNPSMLWSILSKLGRSYRIEGGGKLLAEWPAAS